MNNKILYSERNQVKVKVPLTPRRVTFHLSGIFPSPFKFWSSKKNCVCVKGGRMKKVVLEMEARPSSALVL